MMSLYLIYPTTVCLSTINPSKTLLYQRLFKRAFKDKKTVKKATTENGSRLL